MNTIYIIMIVVGFIAGNVCGIMLSLTPAMQNSDGTVSQGKQVMYSVVITISALMIIAGQWLYTASYSY
jgi:spore maturation protein SpmA